MQKAPKTIAFHSNQLSIRGTEIALYDYAHHFEAIYGGRSIILTPAENSGHDVRAAERFSKRFKLIPYASKEELDQILNREGVDLFYCIKAGFDDGLITKVCKTLVHAVFPFYEPHGDIYAYVSSWLSKEMSGGKSPFIPHMISLPEVQGNLREELGIPSSATVLGRIGGPESFDIQFVRELIPLVLQHRPDLYFLFANTPSFCPPHPQIIHLDGFSDPHRKVKFIQSCDAMLHARERGETFGIAVGEFATLGKPVLTWNGSKEKSHLESLGEAGIFYTSAEDLASQLLSMRGEQNFRTSYYQDFSPVAVMNKFMEVASMTL